MWNHHLKLEAKDFQRSLFDKSKREFTLRMWKRKSITKREQRMIQEEEKKKLKNRKRE
jgi:hypothetical protein